MTLRYDANAVEAVVPTENGPRMHRLTHPEVALLTDYEAHALMMPPYMQAVLTVTIEGRIDRPDFKIEHAIEPFAAAHAWVSYKRVGALLFVGERMLRLNLQQLKVLDALDAIKAVGTDIAARLKLWTPLMEALNMPGKHHVLVQSDIPAVRVNFVTELPAQALTREGAELRQVEHVPDARWAMQPGRRYFVREARV